MSIDLPKRMHVSQDKRILNEFGSKILNEERVEKVNGMREKASRLAPFGDSAFRCECDDQECVETISLSTEMYQKVHTKTKQFIVVPSHYRPDIEDVAVRLPTYMVVEKFFPHPKSQSI